MDLGTLDDKDQNPTSAIPHLTNTPTGISMTLKAENVSRRVKYSIFFSFDRVTG